MLTSVTHPYVGYALSFLCLALSLKPLIKKIRPSPLVKARIHSSQPGEPFSSASDSAPSTPIRSLSFSSTRSPTRTPSKISKESEKEHNIKFGTRSPRGPLRIERSSIHSPLEHPQQNFEVSTPSRFPLIASGPVLRPSSDNSPNKAFSPREHADRGAKAPFETIPTTTTPNPNVTIEDENDISESLKQSVVVEKIIAEAEDLLKEKEDPSLFYMMEYREQARPQVAKLRAKFEEQLRSVLPEIVPSSPLGDQTCKNLLFRSDQVLKTPIVTTPKRDKSISAKISAACENWKKKIDETVLLGSSLAEKSTNEEIKAVAKKLKKSTTVVQPAVSEDLLLYLANLKLAFEQNSQCVHQIQALMRKDEISATQQVKEEQERKEKELAVKVAQNQNPAQAPSQNSPSIKKPAPSQSAPPPVASSSSSLSIRSGTVEAVYEARIAKVRELEAMTDLEDMISEFSSFVRRQLNQISHDRVKIQQRAEGIVNTFSSLPPQVLDFAVSHFASFLNDHASRCVPGDGQYDPAFDFGLFFTIVWQGVLSRGYANFEDIFLGHIYKSCPFVAPFVPSRKSNQTEEDHNLQLGFLPNEDRKAYFRRLTGFVRVYAAIIQTDPINGNHPHGCDAGWLWLSRILNAPPTPVISSIVIHAFLKVAGYRLLQVFGKQFLKIMLTLHQSYIPQLAQLQMSLGGEAEAHLKNLQEVVEDLLNGKALPPKGRDFIDDDD